MDPIQDLMAVSKYTKNGIVSRGDRSCVATSEERTRIDVAQTSVMFLGLQMVSVRESLHSIRLR